MKNFQDKTSIYRKKFEKKERKKEKELALKQINLCKCCKTVKMFSRRETVIYGLCYNCNLLIKERHELTGKNIFYCFLDIEKKIYHSKKRKETTRILQARRKTIAQRSSVS